MTWFADKLLPGLIIGAIASWLIPTLFDRYRTRRDFKARAAEQTLELIEQIAVQAAGYWLQPGRSKELAEVEEHLLFRLDRLRLALNSFAPDLMSGVQAEGVQAVGDLVAAVSGGAFGQAKRAADPTRAAEVRYRAIALIRLIDQQRGSWLRSSQKAKLPR